ncbi:hypothetical protein E4U55_003739 [Claviceps digitariae]|nr:hypothetical protein E4U55_003739 [Claviceps digitariae]
MLNQGVYGRDDVRDGDEDEDKDEGGPSLSGRGVLRSEQGQQIRRQWERRSRKQLAPSQKAREGPITSRRRLAQVRRCGGAAPTPNPKLHRLFLARPRQHDEQRAHQHGIINQQPALTVQAPAPAGILTAQTDF